MLTVFPLVVVVQEQNFSWITGTLAVLTAAPVALRQIAPVTTVTVILSALLIYWLLGYGEILSGGITVLVGVFTVATLCTARVTALVCAAAMVVVTMVCYNELMPATDWPRLAGSVLFLPGAWMLGEATRRRARRIEMLQAKAAGAAAEERARIARDLHDVVVHHMSVVSMQSGVAAHKLEADPSSARRAIEAAGDASRSALTDLRRMLQVLQINGADSGNQPVGLAAIDELAQQMSAPGHPVDVAVTGAVRQLPAEIDMCAYRVLQESLTNVLKHAGPATARVNVHYGTTTLTLSVTDDGIGAPASPASPLSQGIRGMRERVELCGGDFAAGPSDSGGFAVLVRLPTGTDR